MITTFREMLANRAEGSRQARQRVVGIAATLSVHAVLLTALIQTMSASAGSRRSAVATGMAVFDLAPIADGGSAGAEQQATAPSAMLPDTPVEPKTGTVPQGVSDSAPTHGTANSSDPFAHAALPSAAPTLSPSTDKMQPDAQRSDLTALLATFAEGAPGIVGTVSFLVSLDQDGRVWDVRFLEGSLDRDAAVQLAAMLEGQQVLPPNVVNSLRRTILGPLQVGSSPNAST